MGRTFLNHVFSRLNFSVCVILCLMLIPVSVPNLCAAGNTGFSGISAGSIETAGGVSTGSVTSDDDQDDDIMMDDLLNEAGPDTVLPEPETGDTGGQLPLRFEGQMISSLWMPVHDPDTLYTSNRMDLRGWKNISALKFEGRFRLDYQDLEGSNKTRADIRELYAGYRTDAIAGRPAEFFLGKKMIYWGKGDEVRPLDRVCPQDYTSFLFYDLNDRKTGRTGIFFNIETGQDLRFEGFWSPYFEADASPGLHDFFEPGVMKKFAALGIDINEADSPNEWAPDAGLGGRVMFSLFKADIALYGFYGRDSAPVYKISRLGAHPLTGLYVIPKAFQGVHPRMGFVGMDIERSAGPFVLRAEAAYQNEGAFYGVDFEHRPLLLLKYPEGVVQKDQIQYVLGLDRNDLFVHNLFLNLQYFGRYIVDYTNEIAVPETTTGMTAYLRYSLMDSRLTLSYRMTAFFEARNNRHRLEAGYKALSWLETSIGFVWYDGKSSTGYFGQYDDNDFIYAKMKIVF